jgi:hypothetical protein
MNMAIGIILCMLCTLCRILMLYAIVYACHNEYIA